AAELAATAARSTRLTRNPSLRIRQRRQRSLNPSLERGAPRHPRQRARTFQALLRAALFGFLPDLRVPFCLPLADRAELLFGDQERHHVFPVVGFSFQPLTVHLSLGITHLAAHIVFGLNRGHSGEPTTAWPIGANSSATFVHHEYPCSHDARPGKPAVPTRSHADVRCPIPRVG